MRRPAWSCNARRRGGLSECCDGNSADRDKLAVKCKTLHKWQSFYSLLMYGRSKAFPKQSPFKHVHEAKERLQWGVWEHHGMVVLCGLVLGQNFSLKWLTLGFVKRWCICGFSTLLFHSFNPKDDLLKATFLFTPPPFFLYLILHACNWQATLRNQPNKRHFFLLMCVYLNMCVPGGGRQGQKWLIILTNIWIFTSSTPQVYFKHFQTMSSICQVRYLANALIHNVLH